MLILFHLLILMYSHTATKSYTVSKNELDALRQLMKQLEMLASSFTSLFAQSGRYAFAFSASVSSSRPSWIIDFGASDDMTGNSSFFFSTYQVYSSKYKVRTDDGSLSSITRKGTIPLSSMFLSSVLHVPNHALNLVSVSNLTKSLNCPVIFFPSHCVFQDLETKRNIGKVMRVIDYIFWTMFFLPPSQHNS